MTQPKKRFRRKFLRNLQPGDQWKVPFTDSVFEVQDIDHIVIGDQQRVWITAVEHPGVPRRMTFSMSAWRMVHRPLNIEGSE